MNCFTCDRNLSAYIDDELAPEQRLDLESHLEDCERCRKEYETHMTSWEAAEDLRSEDAPEGLWQGIEAELQQKGPDTTLEDLALIVRGLAGEVRELRQAVGELRRDLEAPAQPQPETPVERAPLRPRLSVWEESVSRRTRSGLG